MREEVLAEFFRGRATPPELAMDLQGAEQRASDIESTVRIEDMEEELVVTGEMAISLCDAVLAEELTPDDLATIGFAPVASGKFSWDGEDVLGEVIADWARPEVNYALDRQSVPKFRKWLTKEEPYRSGPEAIVGPGNVVAIRRKVSL